MVDESLSEVEKSLSELEQNALSRKERLKKLRAQLTAANKEETSAGDESFNDPQNSANKDDDDGHDALIFRSYKPSAVDALKINSMRDQMDAIEQSVSDQLKISNDVVIDESLDITTLAPRKVDWDLKRGIQEKLDKLDRRTQKAITQLIRQRLQDGDTNLLVAAVNQSVATDDHHR